MRTSNSTCSPYNGNEASCKTAKCHWCPCTHMCVPIPMKSTCDVGCIGLCGQLAKCGLYGCIYDNSRGQCYDYAIDTVDFKKICSDGNCDKNACTAKGCRFCDLTRACITPNMSIGCDPGCGTFCDKTYECHAWGCTYDYKSGECQPSVNKKYGHSVNLCKDEAGTVNGIYYSKTEYLNIKNIAKPVYCYCNPGAVGGLPDKELYQCYMASPEWEIEIPIRNSGAYNIGIHLVELTGPIGRRQTIRLNGVVIVNEFSLDSIGHRPHVPMVNFEVNCDITEATIARSKVPIVDKKMVMHLKSIPHRPGDVIDAVLSAYYLEKLDGFFLDH